MNNNDERDYAEEEYNLHFLHETDNLYESVVFIQNSDDYAKFAENMIDCNDGLEYLKQWYYGEPSDDRTTAPMLCGRQCKIRHETDEWLMMWCGRHGMAALWLKISD